MRKFNLMMLAALAVCMAACSGSSSSIEFTDPAITNGNSSSNYDISGDLSAESITPPALIPGAEYASIGKKQIAVTVNLKVENKVEGEFCWVSVEVELCDENGTCLVETQSNYDTAEGLIGAEPGKIVAISLKTEEEDGSVYEDLIKRIKKARVLVGARIEEESKLSSLISESSDDSDSSTSEEVEDEEVEDTDNSTDSEDWNSILDSYERCVDKYIALAKKAAGGDVSAISEYTGLLEESQELSEKLSNATSSLSSSQLSRYNRIAQKMASAAQQMQ